ncbi:MAG: hypothetical protein OEW35_17340 [Gammaproteobacteria bacterium]|nr:hypothetical protein [Gammaproteobacteria bacterium]MDH4255959.1 hypothetical protein [Gammaproteobacteria bacterium]MDH5311646.1 hypothetical protein [Gammaproteobacteria bacterium]
MNIEDEVESADAHISYLAPGSFVNRRFVAPGREVNTGSYETHRVRIRDGRSIRDHFTLDTHGFVVTDHRSAVRDFTDTGQIEAIYPAETAELVRRLTGADRVIVRGWMTRTSGDLEARQRQTVGYTHQGGVQPPAAEAHVDFTAETAERVARATYESEFPGEAPFRRFISSSLWRCYSEPPQDWPIAVCDARSVGPDEGTPNALVVVDEIPDPETMLGPLPAGRPPMTADVFRYNPAHRWWYFSAMHRDEALLLKFYDSGKGIARRVPHTAFRDRSFPEARVRESIEVRTLAYFL